MKAEHEQHIRDRFAAATVRDDPFPHVVIDGVLPPDLHREMDAAAPPPAWCTALIALSRFKSPWASIPVHFALRDHNLSSFGLHRFEQSWKRFADIITLVDEMILSAFRARLESYLSTLQRAGIILNTSPPQLGQAIFCHRTRSWEIGPHLHNISQLVQSMIYFPLPGSNTDQGTIFFRFRDLDRSITAADLGRTVMIPRSEVKEATRVAYEPNRLISWMNTPLAIHASSNVSGPNRRYTFTAISTSVELDPGDRRIVLSDFSECIRQ